MSGVGGRGMDTEGVPHPQNILCIRATLLLLRTMDFNEPNGPE